MYIDFLECNQAQQQSGVKEHSKVQSRSKRNKSVIKSGFNSTSDGITNSFDQQACKFIMKQLTRLLSRQSPVLVRPFSTSRTLRIKEDVERSPEEAEKAKQEQLKKQEWNRGTASASEEVVGADQQKVKDHDKHMEELQKQTAQKSEENHPQGKS